MTRMTCADLDRWLDEGRPLDQAGAAAAHASSCERCGAALASFAALEAALRAPPPGRAPAGFAASVMGGAAAERRLAPPARAVRPPRRFPLLAWTLWGSGLGLAAWGAAELAARLSRGAPAAGLASVERALAAGAGLPPAAQAGLALCFAAAATWGSLALARGAEARALGRRR